LYVWSLFKFFCLGIYKLSGCLQSLAFDKVQHKEQMQNKLGVVDKLNF
jgi:hypothetical protein